MIPEPPNNSAGSNLKKSMLPSRGGELKGKSKSSSGLLTTTTSSSSTARLATKRKEYVPFSDVRVRQSGDSTVQSTNIKGVSRTSHTQRAGTNALYRPVIVPDPASKIASKMRTKYLLEIFKECARICRGENERSRDMATKEELICYNKTKMTKSYCAVAKLTLVRLRNMPIDVQLSCPSDSSRLNRSKSSDAVTSSGSNNVVKFKTNSIRVAHNSRISKSDLQQSIRRKSSETSPEQLSAAAILRSRSLSREPTETLGTYAIANKYNKFSEEEVFERMCEYLLTPEELDTNGFPRPTEEPGQCTFKHENAKPPSTSEKKICSRCGKGFNIHKDSDEDCVFHWGRAYPTKVGSTWEKRYDCCQERIGAEGCTYGDNHVHMDNLYHCGGYVQTLSKSQEEMKDGTPGIYGIDCEMCYTVKGLELTRVSVTDYHCNTVYDTFVKPSSKIIDYNTRWSGVTEEDMRNVKTTLQHVQAIFLNKFSDETIFIGHSLESDLKALRIIHDCVIDTSVVFPHKNGPPYKRKLKNLMREHLGIVIQSGEALGHDSTEDANACIKLMRYKLTEDAKVSK